MDRLAYDVVDVFTDTAFTGNPLAVVHDADGLHDAQLQAIATEFHLSETAFPVTPAPDDLAAGAAYRLRIFTPETELPFAGHPSVGTAWLLARQGRIAPGPVVQACGAGLLGLAVSDGEGPVELTGGRPELGPDADVDAVLAAVGLGHPHLDHAIAPARIAAAGLPFVILPVRADALGECEVDVAALREVDRRHGMTGVYVVAVDLPARAVRARMFAADIGVSEDPATGSAALALGVWLGASGRLADGEHGLVVQQGVELGRPSLLRVTALVDGAEPRQVRVAGDVVHVASGTIRVP